MEGDEKKASLRTAYQEVCNSFHAIDDFRARLLGLLPLASGAGIFLLLDSKLSEAENRLYLLPIGFFGVVVTVALFLYELTGIKLCDELIKVGEKIEKDLELEGKGQFKSLPDVIKGRRYKVVACSIYSVVLGTWIFVAFVFISYRWALVFSLVGIVISFFFSFVWPAVRETLSRCQNDRRKVIV